MTNGVKYRAVLSPILFTMYIDGLSYELKRVVVGFSPLGYKDMLGSVH